jgi:hypothetical protein
MDEQWNKLDRLDFNPNSKIRKSLDGTRGYVSISLKLYDLLLDKD